ncbi:metal ABC transporter permease [Leucothrix sargassi]|nr:metal ABC transporter permease [Leucothrix sargassi]
MFLLEVFEYDFMNRALIVGFFTAICTAMLGNFVVTARQAVVSDMLAHTALVGVGLGVFWNLSPTFLALITTVVAAIVLWWLSRSKDQAPEAISMLLLTGGLATALLLTHLQKNNPVSLETYLFGSILTITESEMWSFIVLSLVVSGVLVVCWRQFMTMVFDKEFFKTQRYAVCYEILFMILIALVVGIGLKVIGGLLIGALLVIPVLVAQGFGKSFRHNAWISVFVNLLAITAGIVSSFYLDVPTSSGIVLSLIALYVLSKLLLLIKN